MADRILRTEKGSVVKRSKYGVGKAMGQAIYVHRNYEHMLPNQPQLTAAKQTLQRNHPTFKYNAVKLDPKSNRTTFFNSPDFDTAHEPVAGEYVTVDGNRSKASKTNKIWHHKWMWVQDDYPGFNVDDSFNRSALWLEIPGINFNHIGEPRIWNEQYIPKINALAAKKAREKAALASR